MKPLYKGLLGERYINLRDYITPFRVSWYIGDTILREIRLETNIHFFYDIRNELERKWNETSQNAR